MRLAGRFGAVDGRFLGVSLRWGQTGSATEVPWLPPTCVDARAAAPLITRLRPEAALEGLLEASSLAHELRHFHDFMLSPLGSYLVRTRCVATANTMPLLAWFADRPGVLPVPLSRWITMPPEVREQYWRRASRLSAVANGEPLARLHDVPYREEIEPWPAGGDEGEVLEDQGGVTRRRFGENSFSQVLLLIAGQLERTRLMLDGAIVGDELWGPAQIFEANALATQVQHVRLTANEELANGVMSALAAGQSGYSTVLKRITSILGGSHESDVSRVAMPAIGTVCTYALLGSCEPNYLPRQPLVRFFAIIEHLHRNGESSTAATPELFAEWDEALEERGVLTTPTLTGLEDSLDFDAELARSLRRNLASEQTDPALPVTLACLQFLEARQQLCRAFLEDPERYVRPKAYLEFTSELPCPAIEIITAGGQGERVGELLREAGWDCLHRDNESKLLVQPPASFLGGHAYSHLGALDAATEAMMGCEMIFADNPAVSEAGMEFLERVFGHRMKIMRVTANPGRWGVR